MYKEDKQRKIQVSKYIQYVKKDIYIYIYIYWSCIFRNSSRLCLKMYIFLTLKFTLKTI